MKIKLAILTGGSSKEREISYKSCQNLICILNYDKYKVKVFELPETLGDLEWIEKLIKFKPDIVFNALHGGQGENGDIQGFLNTLNIKYVGSDVLASRIAIDKQMTKQLMKNNFVPVVDGIFIPFKDDVLDYKESIIKLGFPLILKPNKSGGSIGISIAKNFDEVLDATEKIKKLEDDILVEKFIKGTEVFCAVIDDKKGPFVLPVLDIEINKEDEGLQFFDYQAKYDNEKENAIFSNLPSFLKTMIQEIAKKVFLALNCTGYAGIDFIIQEENIYFLEINTLPGLTKTSLLTQTIEHAGMDFAKVIDDLIELELK